MSLYTDLIAAGVPVDSHESDLYALVTPESARLVGLSGRSCSRFISQIDGRTWFDVPFAFDPWWERRQSRATVNI